MGSTRAAPSRLSTTCPQPWTSTLSEVPNEEADRSPDGRRLCRRDSQRRGAGARHADDNRPIRDTGETRQSAEQEDRQVGGQEKGQSQKDRIQELKRHPPLRAARHRKGGTSRLFLFCSAALRPKGYNRGPEPGGAGLNSRAPTPILPLSSLSPRRSK